MSLKNRGAKPARVPDVELGCKGGLGPQGFGLTGVMVGSDTKISPHAARRGDLILYPYQVCEDSTVRFSTRVRTSGHVRTEQVTYSLKGLI